MLISCKKIVYLPYNADFLYALHEPIATIFVNSEKYKIHEFTWWWSMYIRNIYSQLSQLLELGHNHSVIPKYRGGSSSPIPLRSQGSIWSYSFLRMNCRGASLRVAGSRANSRVTGLLSRRQADEGCWWRFWLVGT